MRETPAALLSRRVCFSSSVNWPTNEAAREKLAATRLKRARKEPNLANIVRKHFAISLKYVRIVWGSISCAVGPNVVCAAMRERRDVIALLLYPDIIMIL